MPICSMIKMAFTGFWTYRNLRHFSFIMCSSLVSSSFWRFSFWMCHCKLFYFFKLFNCSHLGSAKLLFSFGLRSSNISNISDFKLPSSTPGWILLGGKDSTIISNIYWSTKSLCSPWGKTRISSSSSLYSCPNFTTKTASCFTMQSVSYTHLTLPTKA